MGRKRFVDLSISIEPELPSDPPLMIPKIDYIDHAQGAEQMKDFFPGLSKDQLPGGMGWALEFLTLTTHSGTHLDAPYHYHPTMDKGKPSLTIDEVPLEWCFNDGVLLDFRHKGDGERITVEDLEKELQRIHYEPQLIGFRCSPNDQGPVGRLNGFKIGNHVSCRYIEGFDVDLKAPDFFNLQKSIQQEHRG